MTRHPISRRLPPAFAVLALATALAATPGAADARQRPDDLGRPLVRVDPCADPRADCAVVPPRVVRTATDVVATLRRGAVGWEVTQTFTNRGSVPGETEFLCPLPVGAAFDDLRLSIDGALVAGEVLGADEARRIYEDIVRRTRDPALVEWMGHGLVRTRVFPILPGEAKRVVLRYTQPAQREGDALRIDWRPPRGAAMGGDAPTSFTLRVGPARDGEGLGTPYSPTHALSPVTGESRTYRADVGGADLTVLVPSRLPREGSIAMLTHTVGTGEGWALVTLTPPPGTPRRQPRDVTFVLDVSGSMTGRKLDQAKAAGRQLLATLGAGDRLRLVAFSGDVQPWRERFTPVTPAAMREATAWLDALEASGGTNIDAALGATLRALGGDDEGGLPLVFFVTDGEPTVGERDAGRLADSARAWRGRARLYTFGLGADVNAGLVERLALEGRGTAQFVRPEESVERAVGLAAQRLSTPLVTDLRLRANGVRLRHVMPELPMDVFAGQDAVLLAQVEGSGDATLIFSGRGPDGPVEWRQPVRVPTSEPGNAFVGKLWATQRAGWLSAERRRNGPTVELDDELRRLGERWGIPTELTSYLVVEPGMRQRGLPSAPSASSAADRFEAARRSSSMRAAQNMAEVAQALPVAPPPGRPAERDRAASAERLVAGRRLVLAGGTWLQVGLDTTARRTTVRVRPFSAAWFALVRGSPVLRDLLAVGDRVRVGAGDVVVVVAPDGAEALTPAEVQRTVRAFAR